MRSALRFGLVTSLLLSATVSPATAARSSRPAAAAPGSDDASGARLLSAAQGEELVNFALDSGARLRPRPDCSHLVHLVYSRAGLSYPYQHSRVLYRGVPDFERVTKPQPGDLIVWLGHVGIVVSPEDKTFFSSVRSGIFTESWTADHWRARGRPHFFRYRIGPDTDLELLASLARDDRRAQNKRRIEDDTRAKIEARNEAGAQDGSEGDSDAVAAGRDAAPNRTARAARSAANNRTSSRTGPSAQASRAAISTGDQPEARAPGSGEDFASIVAVVHQRKQPDKQAITAAFLETGNAAALKLINADVPALGRNSVDEDRPLSVFARVEVAKIRVRHDAGSVTLKLSEVMSLEQGRVLPARTVERELSIYRSSSEGSTAWVISNPHRRTYIPLAQAISVFQRQAELLLHRAPNSTAARAAVKALDLLYDQQPLAPQRIALK